MSDEPSAGQLWKRNVYDHNGNLRTKPEEYYFINSIDPSYSYHNQGIDALMVHFTVIRDGDKPFEAETDMENFIKSTIRVK